MNGAVTWVRWAHYVKIKQLVSRFINICIGISLYLIYLYRDRWNSQHFYFALTFGIYSYFFGELVVEFARLWVPSPCHDISFWATFGVVNSELDLAIFNLKRFCQIALTVQIGIVLVKEVIELYIRLLGFVQGKRVKPQSHHFIAFLTSTGVSRNYWR